MISDNTGDNEKKIRPCMSPVGYSMLNATRSTLLRMPAGGWFSEVSMKENWRTTTVVRQYRDRALPTPPP